MDGDPNNGDALLEAVIAGDLDQHDPRVQALLAAQPALRAQLAAMQRVAAELDAAAADDRRTMQQVMAGSEPPATEARHVVTPLGRPKRPRLLLLAMAAVVLGGVMLGIRWWPAPQATPDSILGSPATERWPVGEVSEADYGEFRWSLPLPEGGYYVLRIYDGDGDTELLPLPPLYESRWRPTAEQRAKLRPRMTWEVEAQRLDGHVKNSLGRVAVSLRH